jgi:hypothetical protein
MCFHPKNSKQLIKATKLYSQTENESDHSSQALNETLTAVDANEENEIIYYHKSLEQNPATKNKVGDLKKKYGKNFTTSIKVFK